MSRNSIGRSFFAVLALVVLFASLSFGAFAVVQAQSDQANSQLLISEVFTWCSTNDPEQFCGDGPGFELLPGTRDDADRVHFRGPGIDFDCRTFAVPEGVSAVFWDGEIKQELPATGGSRTINACEAIFSVDS